MTKYREYDARYQELQAKADTLEAEKQNRQGRIKRFEVFIQALKKQHGELTAFDDDTWLSVIETVLVRPDRKLVFRFVNGMEVESREDRAFYREHLVLVSGELDIETLEHIAYEIEIRESGIPKIEHTGDPLIGAIDLGRG